MGDWAEVGSHSSCWLLPLPAETEEGTNRGGNSTRHIVLILIISHAHVKCLSPVLREAYSNVPSLIFQAILLDKIDLAFFETGFS